MKPSEFLMEREEAMFFSDTDIKKLDKKFISREEVLKELKDEKNSREDCIRKFEKEKL